MSTEPEAQEPKSDLTQNLSPIETPHLLDIP
jgi:hypothetical protein